MGKKSKKLLLYTLCFTCIMLIDWTRGSINWNYWAPILNLTGVVMSVVMLSHFTWKGQPLKLYCGWLALWLFGSVVGFFVWRANPGTVFLAQYITAAFMVGCLGIVGIRIRQERLGPTKFSPVPAILVSVWVIMSVLMMLSRYQELWPVWFLVMFAMFYLIPFSEDEKSCLWDGLANGTILGFFLIQIFAYGFRPYDEVRYRGAYANCNMNALLYLVTYIMVLYHIHSMFWREREGKDTGAAKTGRNKAWINKAWKLFYLILASGLFSFTLFTMTRTAILAAVAITLLFGGLETFVIIRMKPWQILAGILAFVLGVAFTFPCVYLTIRYLPTILHHPIWWEGEYHEDKVHSFDPYNSYKYVSIQEVLEGLLERVYSGYGEERTEEPSEIGNAEIGNTESSVVKDALYIADETVGGYEVIRAHLSTGAERALTEEVINLTADSENLLTAELGEHLTAESENLSVEESGDPLTGEAEALMTETEKELLTGEAAQSSGRIRLEIYKRYLRHLNLTGHTLMEGYFPITEDYHAWHAQNVFLQVAFYHGIPAGICFVILMVSLGIWSIKLAANSRRREDILPLLVCLLFVGFGMLECVWYLGQSILLLMYLVPKILIDNRKNSIC